MRAIEHILSGEAAASDPIYRLANAVRDGVSGQEELRLSRPLDPSREPVPTWYRVKARPVAGIPDQTAPVYAWQIADISAERAEQERYFQDIQEAIDHLDHAPAGFFSADPDGRIIYINATLAEWLGVDLTRFTPGSMMVRDIVAGNGMALINAVKTEPGTSRNTVIDLDLAKANGQSLAVRFYHRVQAQRDGKARPNPHHRAQPRRRRGHFSGAARGGSAVHALLQFCVDGHCCRRCDRQDPAHQCALPRPVLAGS